MLSSDKQAKEKSKKKKKSTLHHQYKIGHSYNILITTLRFSILNLKDNSKMYDKVQQTHVQFMKP